MPHIAIQGTMCLVGKMRQRPGNSSLLTSPPILASLVSSCIYCLSCLSYLISRSWSVVENFLFPITYQIRYVLAHSKLRNISSADVTGFWRPRQAFLTNIVLRVPAKGVRDFYFPNKLTEAPILLTIGYVLWYVSNIVIIFQWHKRGEYYKMTCRMFFHIFL